MEFPKFTDKDNDLDHHLEAFSEMCNMMGAEANVDPADKLKLFGTTLEGTRKMLRDHPQRGKAGWLRQRSHCSV